MADPDSDIAGVQAALGHVFADRALLIDALTHRSFLHERGNLARTDNEQLEFMGDAVLQWTVSALLVERFPAATAGELTRRRADLVCEEGLAAIARDLHVGAGLRLGRGEERSGGREKPRLLASALEACIAAVFLDGGTLAVERVCRAIFDPRILSSEPGARDFKTRVQEALQSRGQRPPTYSLLSVSGPEHARCFAVVASIDDTEVARGQGKSRLEAEQAAAEQAFTRLSQRDL